VFCCVVLCCVVLCWALCCVVLRMGVMVGDGNDVQSMGGGDGVLLLLVAPTPSRRHRGCTLPFPLPLPGVHPPTTPPYPTIRLLNRRAGPSTNVVLGFNSLSSCLLTPTPHRHRCSHTMNGPRARKRGVIQCIRVEARGSRGSEGVGGTCAYIYV
jgi:hypothetical protein